MKSYLLALTILICLSCANSKQVSTMEEQSVGQIPCPAEKIEIIERKVDLSDGSATWMALCSGETYSCQRAADTGDNTIQPQVTCTKMESQMPE